PAPHEPAGRGAAVQGDRGGLRPPCRGRAGHGPYRPGRGDAARGGHRNARWRGLAADQPARCAGASFAGGRRGHPRHGVTSGRERVMLLAEDPTLADFGHDPWWLVLIKVVFAFIFGAIGTVLGVWFERRVVARMAVRPGPNQA